MHSLLILRLFASSFSLFQISLQVPCPVFLFSPFFKICFLFRPVVHDIVQRRLGEGNTVSFRLPLPSSCFTLPVFLHSSNFDGHMLTARPIGSTDTRTWV